MTSALLWMVHQSEMKPAPVRTTSPNALARRPRRNVLVKRFDGSVVPISCAQEELRAAALEVLRRYGPRPLAEIRELLSTGFFVASDARGQAAELSAALKSMRSVGDVQRDDVMPYVWRSAAIAASKEGASHG